MKTVSGREMARLAKRHGWTLSRVNGSHQDFTKEGRTERLVIPIHGNRDLPRGLQLAFMRIIPITEADL
ncbi:MAG: type II toxin-antitoxin system HicA family toxin [Opitutales bacterium]